MNIGVLHPGLMGSAIGGQSSGRVIWASKGRSPATRRRAEEARLQDVGGLDSLVDQADVILSICPPAAAKHVSDEVASRGFAGIYVDANAVSPAIAKSMAQRFARFVDGSVIGGPPAARGDTRLYLSGAEADAVASLFSGSLFEARVIGVEPGLASALKMAYAGWTKGTTALLLACVAIAESHGVLEALREEWAQSLPGLVERAGSTASGIGQKAWRFEGEMLEIARTYETAGLPGGFHHASADIFGRLAGLKSHSGPATVADIVEVLLKDGG